MSITISQECSHNNRFNFSERSDEADVFLESRAGGVASNTERNALVSGEQN